MHKWNAHIVTPDGRSHKGRAKIISERAVSVRANAMVERNTVCQVGIALPKQPGTAAMHQVDIQCSVAQVVFGSNGIRLEMAVKSVPHADQELFCEYSGKHKN